MSRKVKNAFPSGGGSVNKARGQMHYRVYLCPIRMKDIIMGETV